VHRAWELDKGQILQCTGAGNWAKVRYYSAGARNWTKVRYYSAQDLGIGQRSDITVQELGTGQRSDITVHRTWELDKGQILQRRSHELDKGQVLQLASENRSYLGEFKAEFKKEKALARESGEREQGVLFNEKNRRSKISWHYHFNKNVSYT
jgi:hypothetical protein